MRCSPKLVLYDDTQPVCLLCESNGACDDVGASFPWSAKVSTCCVHSSFTEPLPSSYFFSILSSLYLSGLNVRVPICDAHDLCCFSVCGADSHVLASPCAGWPYLDCCCCCGCGRFCFRCCAGAGCWLAPCCGVCVRFGSVCDFVHPPQVGNAGDCYIFGRGRSLLYCGGCHSAHVRRMLRCGCDASCGDCGYPYVYTSALCEVLALRSVLLFAAPMSTLPIYVRSWPFGRSSCSVSLLTKLHVVFALPLPPGAMFHAFAALGPVVSCRRCCLPHDCPLWGWV